MLPLDAVLTLSEVLPMDEVQSNFMLSVKMVTLIFISWGGSAISSAKQGKSGSTYNLMKK